MSASGKWTVTIQTAVGPQVFEVEIEAVGEHFTGRSWGATGESQFEGTIADNVLTWSTKVSQPMPMTVHFSATIDGDTLQGEAKLGMFGKARLKGVRAA